jgi:hypothetical protein
MEMVSFSAKVVTSHSYSMEYSMMFATGMLIVCSSFASSGAHTIHVLLYAIQLRIKG